MQQLEKRKTEERRKRRRGEEGRKGQREGKDEYNSQVFVSQDFK